MANSSALENSGDNEDRDSRLGFLIPKNTDYQAAVKYLDRIRIDPGRPFIANLVDEHGQPTSEVLKAWDAVFTVTMYVSGRLHFALARQILWQSQKPECLTLTTTEAMVNGYAKAFLERQNYDPQEGSFSNWCSGIVKNSAHDLNKDQIKENKKVDALKQEHGNGAKHNQNEVPNEGDLDAEDDTDEAIPKKSKVECLIVFAPLFAKRIEKLVESIWSLAVDSQLTPKQAAILKAREREGLRYREIATKHQISMADVKVTILRARESIQTGLWVKSRSSHPGFVDFIDDLVKLIEHLFKEMKHVRPVPKADHKLTKFVRPSNLSSQEQLKKAIISYVLEQLPDSSRSPVGFNLRNKLG